MNKSAINTFIQNMKKADNITKSSEWMIEGRGNSKAEIRYVGVLLNSEWEEVFSRKNNLLFQFTLINKEAFLDILLANVPPFVKLTSQRLTESDKWENILGQLRNTLKTDKQDFLHHRDSIDNVYKKIVKILKV